jgi:hypothetical protein
MNLARRSVGVVLIVALVGWAVNQPMGCQSQHSRAAVGVPAGASPAYQPEPSTSRHNCCPPKRASALTPENPAAAICALHPHSKPPDCCSFSRPSRPGLPARVWARAWFVSVAQVLPAQLRLPSSGHISNRFSAHGGAPVDSSAFTVFRL